MSEITIVTAFFDIGRGHINTHQARSVDTYFEYFVNLAKIKNDMIVYTTKEFEQKVINLRLQHGNKNTKVITLDSYLIDKDYNPKIKIEKIMNSVEFISKVHYPKNIEYWNADYVLINLFKSFYVVDAIEKGYAKTDLVAWIDFGYCRNEHTMSLKDKWSYKFEKDKISIFNMRIIDNRPIEDIIYTGDVYIQGCHIVAGQAMWLKLKSLMIESFDELLSNNLFDDDQTILLLSYKKSPESFLLRFNSPFDWFRIFKDYS